ncbi:hypothetical protein Syun_028676 [Stephania yunnanensis]|uniref:Carbohydrate-binding-like fold protein n=1 Tax=Stephania yunnanensis TaxID=152371 RepID=A0AAP0E8K0_9MAGN
MDRPEMPLKLIFSLIFAAVSATSALADSIHGCGGFVEASSSLLKSRKPSDAKLDYSHITVELQTVDGLVKDSTQCAPNGYYFIPVYDKGSFVIKVKGPEGWTWHPDKVPVVIDHNGCNANADINFQFTGFSLFGRIKGAVGGKSCSMKDGGPSNVKIDLLSPDDDLISSAFTSSVGRYSFSNVVPGKYKLHATHPNLKVEVRGSSAVELGFENSEVDGIFFVPGYDIQGFVVAQGNPILGVHFYLYSDDVSEVDCPQGSGNSPWPKSALCHAISDGDGKFKFTSLPCGAYELLPYYKGENTVFDVSPPSMAVSVEHHDVTIPQRFQVTGFSVGGRVIGENSVGVDGVKIIVDGLERSITDKNGYYKLDQVTSKRYSIKAEKEHYKFNSLENFLVLPNMASIAEIKAVYYDICGVVRTISAGDKAKVTLTHGPDNFKPQMKHTDGTGRFCFEVPPGEYRLSALSAAPESAPGLLFMPPFVDLTVSKPLLDIEFSQAQVNIYGTVFCKERCDSSVSISLVRPSGKIKSERRTVSLSDGNNDFMFPKVFPGKYMLESKRQTYVTSNKDDWCWEQSFIDVEVGTDDVQGITFVQKGYWIDIISTHDADGDIRNPDSSKMKLQIKKGSQKICVESPGFHELHLENSCILFGSTPVKFDTLQSSPIYLKGEKYLLKGQIHIDSSSHGNALELTESIIVDILSSDGAIIDARPVRLVSNEDQTGVTVYEYSVWVNLGDELTFVPRDSRKTEEKRILFYPRNNQVSVNSEGCQASISPFVGRPGLYIEGSVSPPLSGVEIRIIADGESSTALLPRGGLALETLTGDDGVFIGGPLYDDTSYRIEASKLGYYLKQVGPNSFSCQKLSQILVKLSGDESKEQFPSVLLSLSGEDGYRNNSVTGTGGFFQFDNLFPGSFYLRPLLKEYSFSPSAQAVELGSGESKEVVFRATRVAYSATGTVSLLSGQPKEGISVEARSDKGYYEETRTDSYGSYRLRGLLPDTTYSVRVVAKDELTSTRIERASPETIAVKVGKEDIKELDFVVFEQPDTTILSGHIEGNNLREFESNLLVEVKLASDPSKIESVVPLPLSRFFQIKNLPKTKHLVQLRHNLPSSMHKFESEIIEVDLDKKAQVHIGPIGYKIEESTHKQELTVAPVFPLIVGLSVIAVFISMPRLKDLYQSTLSTSGSSGNLKKELKKAVVRKKTY